MNEYIINYGKLNNNEDTHIKIRRRDLIKDDLNLFITYFSVLCTENFFYKLHKNSSNCYS